VQNGTSWPVRSSFILHGVLYIAIMEFTVNRMKTASLMGVVFRIRDETGPELEPFVLWVASQDQGPYEVFYKAPEPKTDKSTEEVRHFPVESLYLRTPAATYALEVVLGVDRKVHHLKVRMEH